MYNHIKEIVADAEKTEKSFVISKFNNESYETSKAR